MKTPTIIYYGLRGEDALILKNNFNIKSVFSFKNINTSSFKCRHSSFEKNYNCCFNNHNFTERQWEKLSLFLTNKIRQEGKGNILCDISEKYLFCLPKKNFKVIGNKYDVFFELNNKKKLYNLIEKTLNKKFFIHKQFGRVSEIKNLGLTAKKTFVIQATMGEGGKKTFLYNNAEKGFNNTEIVSISPFCKGLSCNINIVNTAKQILIYPFSAQILGGSFRLLSKKFSLKSLMLSQ